nr:immunoglobulin heavy chain junction region [Macaca mulatta]MOY29688.1 immunoglobulin heavy chain junction region [Macaca mulatta]MOY30198.1 immunoglobulin heavy chain junction region [Macaca mulatta]
CVQVAYGRSLYW